VTNSESINEHRIIAGKRFATFHSTNFWVKRMKFITLGAVPYILSLVHIELRDARCKFSCWNFHTCNGQRKSWFGCSVSPLVAANVNMTGYPAHYYCFAAVSKLCIDLYCTVNKMYFDSKSTQSFQTRHGVRENNKTLFFTTTNESHCKWYSI